MTSKRLYLILLTIISLLLLTLLGGAYSINKLLGGQADKLLAVKAKSKALEQEQQSLSRAKTNIQQYSNLQQITQAIVPEDKNQAEAVREIVNLAQANDVSLASITFPASSLGSTSPAASPAPATTTPAAAGSATSAATPVAAPPSQLQSVTGIAGVFKLPIIVTSGQSVGYTNFIAFLSALENNRRTAQVGAISLQPNTTSPGTITFTLTINEYIKP